MPTNPAAAATPQAALDCAARALGPVVGMLIDCGVSAAEASHLLRWLFVHEAAAQASRSGKRESISRIAAVTGIPRGEVKALREVGLQTHAPRREGSPQKTSRVLTGWLTDANFLSSEGYPRPLPYSGADPSFSSLAKRYAGDTPPRAVLKELLNSGAVNKIGDELYELTKQENYRISPDVSHLVDVGEALHAAASAVTSDVRSGEPTEPSFILVSSEPIEGNTTAKVRRELRRRANAFALAANQYLLDQSSTTRADESGALSHARVSLFVSVGIEKLE